MFQVVHSSAPSGKALSKGAKEDSTPSTSGMDALRVLYATVSNLTTVLELATPNSTM
jgi:hypothetical protein